MWRPSQRPHMWRPLQHQRMWRLWEQGNSMLRLCNRVAQLQPRCSWRPQLSWRQLLQQLTWRLQQRTWRKLPPQRCTCSEVALYVITLNVGINVSTNGLKKSMPGRHGHHVQYS